MGANVIVSGLSFPMTGYPPFDLDIPLVFDYLDLVDWENHPHKPDLPYTQNADVVLGVSELTCRRGKKYGAKTHHLPNGADISKLREAKGSVVRSKHDLKEATIVSLIGLSVGEGPGNYFIDAVLRANQKDPSLHCLLVGCSETLRSTLRRKDPDRRTFTYVGRVDYNDVAEYYAASDIGLYPAPGGTHDDGRSPIKVFEYTAQGTPVVAAPIREVKRLPFDNIILAEPDVQSFAEGILTATRQPSTDVKEIDEYDWTALARKLEGILMDLQQEKPTEGAATVR
jgi:glycosyltransferase involved in cell wall biosynthesis